MLTDINFLASPRPVLIKGPNGVINPAHVIHITKVEIDSTGTIARFFIETITETHTRTQELPPSAYSPGTPAWSNREEIRDGLVADLEQVRADAIKALERYILT